VMLAVLGMAVSLSIRPRRLFVRVRPATIPEPDEGPDEPATNVFVAGLDRVDGRGGLTDEVAALAVACGLEATLAATDTEPDDKEEQ